MGVVYTTDNNEFLADGVTPNPNYGIRTQSGAPDPEPVPKWNALDFKRRFTQDERVAILTAAQTNIKVKDFVGLLDTAASVGALIHADDPDVIAGLNAYETAGFIGTGRAAQILSSASSP